MANIFKNIILMLILFAAIIMVIGIVFYDYIPNGVEVKEATEYIAEEKTTKTLDIIKVEKTELFGATTSDDETKTETVIQAYSLDAGDLRVYEQSNSYISGKADPFDDIASAPSTSGNLSNNLNTNNTSNSTSNSTTTQKGDNTLFNSTISK